MGPEILTLQLARERTLRAIEKIRAGEKLDRVDQDTLTYWRSNLSGFALMANRADRQRIFRELLADRTLVKAMRKGIQSLEAKRKKIGGSIVPEVHEETLMARSLISRVLSGYASTLVINDMSKILRGQPTQNSLRFVANVKKVLKEPGIAGAVKKAITKYRMGKLMQAKKRASGVTPKRRRKR